MSVKILKNSDTELVITQQKKLTITGSLFSGPAAIILFILPAFPGFILLASCILLWMIAFFCFYHGVTYTFKADRAAQVMELSVKGLIASRKDQFRYEQINHIIMAESGRFFRKPEQYHYHIIIETSDRRFFNFFGFNDRQACKATIALMDSYL